MLYELAGDQLADVARTDDDRLLHVGALAPDRGTRDRTSAGDENDRKRPERDELGHAGAGSTGRPRRDEHEPRTHRREVEDADEVVDRGVIRALVVVVVEPIQ